MSGRLVRDGSRDVGDTLSSKPFSENVEESLLNSASPSRAVARLLTADDLAERWSVPKAHVYRLSRERGLPTVKLGRYYRYRLAAVEAWELELEGRCS